MDFSLTYGILHLIMVATSEKSIEGVEKQRTRCNYFLRVFHKIPPFFFLRGAVNIALHGDSSFAEAALFLGSVHLCDWRSGGCWNTSAGSGQLLETGEREEETLCA